MNAERLHWACRRGLLELDLVLREFIDTRYAALSASEQALFQAFLNESDADLWAWIQGIEPDPRYAPVLRCFRLARF